MKRYWNCFHWIAEWCFFLIPFLMLHFIITIAYRNSKEPAQVNNCIYFEKTKIREKKTKWDFEFEFAAMWKVQIKLYQYWLQHLPYALLYDKAENQWWIKTKEVQIDLSHSGWHRHDSLARESVSRQRHLCTSQWVEKKNKSTVQRSF